MGGPAFEIPQRDPRAAQFFPLHRSPIAPQTFDIGMVLGGTAGAGPWTAGALDFLLEALESWYAAGAPRHRVNFSLVAGTSGGSVSSAILALLARKSVPHFSKAWTANPTLTGNLLWDIWVESIDQSGLLATDDLDGASVVPSVLNAKPIDRAAARLVAQSKILGRFARDYFPDPFRMVLTLANLGGVPYQMPVQGFQGWSGPFYTSHDDFGRFAIAARASVANARPDEFWVDPAVAPGTKNAYGFDTVAAYAIASASMPGVFPARRLERPCSHLLYRPEVIPGPGGSRAAWLTPYWAEMLKEIDAHGTYHSLCVDGGTFNNDPVALAHQALAGLVDFNPRDAASADRALLMIDPLAAKAYARNVLSSDMISALKALVGCVTEGARYLTADMVLLADPNVFSRFQVVPYRTDRALLGEDALAGSKFSALSGFMCRAYRVHDFMLGRLNMQNYLRSEFVLATNNPLFAGWAPAEIALFGTDMAGRRPTAPAAPTFLPIIPDLTLAEAPPGPDIEIAPGSDMGWPVDQIDLEALGSRFEERLKAVIDVGRKQVLSGFLPWLGGEILDGPIASNISQSLMRGYRSELTAAGLISG